MSNPRLILAPAAVAAATLLAAVAVPALAATVPMSGVLRANAGGPVADGAYVFLLKLYDTKDGRKLAHFQPTRKGDPEMPLTDAELNDKFLELAMPVLGDATSRRLLAALWSLEKSKDVEFDFTSRARAAG